MRERRTAIFIRRAGLVGLAVLFASPYAISVEAAGVPTPQNQSIPKQDTSGKGAILCALYLYIETPVAAHLCGLSDAAEDTAFNEAIARIDKFVIQNATQPITQKQLDDFRRLHSTEMAASIARGYGSIQKYCQTADFGFARNMYEATPAAIKASIDKLLSVPPRALVKSLPLSRHVDRFEKNRARQPALF